MNLVELQAEAVRLKDASIFRYGDPSTFAVRLLPDEVELPGPSKPHIYLKGIAAKLGVKIAADSAVAVVGAGNCGLVAEALTAGATTVIAIEPRARFKQAVDHICGMLRSCHPDADISTFLGWPGAAATIAPLDMILWPEGLEESADPLNHMRNLLKLLKPTGLLLVEVNHGTVGAFAGTINCFRPTDDCWDKLVKHLGAKNEANGPGRLSGAAIYKVGRGLSVKDDAAVPAPSEMPAFPRPAPIKKTSPMPPNPENFGGPQPEATEPLPKKMPPKTATSAPEAPPAPPAVAAASSQKPKSKPPTKSKTLTTAFEEAEPAPEEPEADPAGEDRPPAE